MKKRKILHLYNPTKQELYDAVTDASAMDYNRIVVSGHKFRKEFGVRKKVIHLRR